MLGVGRCAGGLRGRQAMLLQAALPAALSAGATLLLGAVLAWVAVEWTNHYVRGRDRGYVYDKRGKRLPGPYNPWPVGFFWSIKKYRENNVWWRESLRIMQEYKSFYGFKIFTLNSVMVGDPALARVVLTGSADDFPKGPLYRKLGLLPGGLLTTNGGVWRHDRRLLYSTFSHAATLGMLPIFNEHLDALMEYFGTTGPEHDMSAVFCRLTLDIVVHAGFGRPSRSLLNGHADEMARAVSDALDESIRRLLDLNPLLKFWPPRLLRARRTLRRLTRVTREVIADSRAGKRTGKNTLIDLMLRATEGGQWTLSKLLAQSITFTIAGHETTASMLCWTLYELCRHPEVVSKLRAEADAALARDSNPNDHVTAEHLEAMPYLRCVLKESLRLHPPVTTISRQTLKEIELGGFVIPPGWNVGVSIYAIHMSEALWERPADFWPERWQDASPLKSPFQFLPFSLGPRDCIGQRFAMMEASVIVARMLRKVDFELLESPDLSDTPMYESVTIRPARLNCRVSWRVI